MIVYSLDENIGNHIDEQNILDTLEHRKQTTRRMNVIGIAVEDYNTTSEAGLFELKEDYLEEEYEEAVILYNIAKVFYSKLSNKEKEVFILHYIQCMSQSEIARIQNCTQQFINKVANNIIKKIKKSNLMIKLYYL